MKSRHSEASSTSDLRPRPDITALLGSTYLNSGYDITVRGLRPGAYTLVAFGRSVPTGTFSAVRQLPVSIAASAQGVIDTPASGALVPGSFTICRMGARRVGGQRVWKRRH